MTVDTKMNAPHNEMPKDAVEGIIGRLIEHNETLRTLDGDDYEVLVNIAHTAYNKGVEDGQNKHTPLEDSLSTDSSIEKQAETLVWYIKHANSEQEAIEHTANTLQSQANQYEREKGLYQELLFAVGNKYEGETRHETALRYIKQAEQKLTPEAKIKSELN